MFNWLLLFRVWFLMKKNKIYVSFISFQFQQERLAASALSLVPMEICIQVILFTNISTIYHKTVLIKLMNLLHKQQRCRFMFRTLLSLVWRKCTLTRHCTSFNFQDTIRHCTSFNFQDTIEYTKSRTAFGQPLLNNQVGSSVKYLNQLPLIFRNNALDLSIGI